MLTQYKNIEQIKSATKSVSAERFERKKLDLFSKDLYSGYYLNNEITNSTKNSIIEMHVYINDTWITGNHAVQNIRTSLRSKNSKTSSITERSKNIVIDVSKEFQLLNITNGSFKFVLNFFKNLIGNYNEQYLRIDEISPDRTEIRLRAIDINSNFLQQITNYIQNVKQTSATFYKSYLLNFSRNQCVLFVNSVVIDDYLYVKLLDPLPDNIEVDFKCWIVEEQKSPYIDNVFISPKQIKKQYNKLANPNWQAFSKQDFSAETGLRTWTDLLGSSVSTSQQIVDSYFSSSLSTADLNIDYSDFNNFIFYSTATERLANFKYKLELLEYYSSQSLILSSISGSTAVTNIQDYSNQISNLISGFDGFEKWMYYDSSSKISTFLLPHEAPIVDELTGSYLSPVPKLNSTIPYNLYSVSSSQFINWYSGVYSSASLYDSLNYNRLVNLVPEFIRFDNNNVQLLTFINMLAQHYDIFYVYVNHMQRIHKRDENPKLSMPNELLFSVAKQFGWTLSNGTQHEELWSYILGTSETGVPLTGSNSINNTSMSGKERTYMIWRRIVNNLPLLLKSKGTKRSIQALLSCYGIPQSFISINEYGGPRLDRAPVYEKYSFNYALDLSSSVSGTVDINYSQSINTVELRFRPDNVETNPLIPNNMNLFNIGSNSVTLEFNSGNKGVLQINGTGSGLIELYNDEWLSAMLKTNGSNLDLIVKKSKYGKIVSAVSASATASFSSTGTLTLGGTSSGTSRFVGQLQELRLWSSSLLESVFDNHVKAAGAYNANLDAYQELIFRLPLNEKINHSLTSSLNGYQPKQSAISASFVSWSLNTPYDSYEETQYYDAVSLAVGTYDDNKIRLETNSLIGSLDIKTRAERSQYDTAPLDSKKLGVYFSPQTMIDEDIIAQLGFIKLDDYIGDPGETESKSYPKLIQIAQSYWKKYADRNDINSYIKMFTLFDLSFFRQLEQLLPARVDKLTGILIQPNILERNKDKILPTIKKFDSTYELVISASSINTTADYLQYLGQINESIVSISANDDDQLQLFLTASDKKKYSGVTYSHEYLIKSGSTFITASSPYWLSDAILPTYIDSTYSEFKLINAVPITSSFAIGYYGSSLYGSSSYYTSNNKKFTGSIARVQDYLPKGINNQRYSGAKIISADFNINSRNTIDGGPVVEFRIANPNQLIYQNQDNAQGSFRLV